MSREEIEQLYVEEPNCFETGREEQWYKVGLREGLAAADSHPAWVSVEDELPPLHYEGANSTDFVLIYDGDDVLIAYYNFKEKKWYNEQYGALIIPATHWMPLPQPPVKKGGQDAR